MGYEVKIGLSNKHVHLSLWYSRDSLLPKKR